MMIQWFAIGWLLSKSRRVGQCFSAVSTAGDARATFVAPWHGDDGRCQRHALLWSGDDVRLCIRCRPGSPWGKPRIGRATAGILGGFFFCPKKGRQPQPREFTNATKILKYQELMFFLLLGVFNVFFPDFFIQFVDFYSKVYVIFPDFALQPGISYTAATVEQRYSYIEWLHFYRKVHRGKKPGWKVGGCSHHRTGQAWVDYIFTSFWKTTGQLFLLGMIFRTLLSRAYLSCGF